MESRSRPCPKCNGRNVKQIVWTEDPAKIGTSDDPAVAFLKGPSIWNQRSDIDRVCADCGERFCNDPARQEKYDEDTRRQKRRIEAMKRGEYMLFDPRTTSTAEIARVVFERVKRSKQDKAKKNGSSD